MSRSTPGTAPLVRDLRWTIRARSGLRALVRRAGAAEPSESHPIGANLFARIGLGSLVVGYVAYFTTWSLKQHYSFSTSGFDLGIFEQGMWLLSRFKAPFVTVLGLDLFGDHTSFILILLVPLWWLFSSTSMLLIVQTLCLGFAAVPVWLIAREKLRDEVLALAVSFAYLAHPAIGLTNQENFHPDSFEVPLVFGIFYFMMKKRWIGYGICLVALLAVKEDVPLMTFVLGIYVAIRYDRKVGVLTSLVSVAWFGSVLFWILPALNGSGTMDAWRVPSAQFGGTGGLLRTALLKPWELVAYALGPDKPWYLWQMAAPLAALFLLAPGVALIAILPLASNLLSTFYYQYHIEYHYGTLIVPVLVTAAIFGIARRRSVRLRASLVAVMTVAALFSGYLWGPLGLARRTASDPASARAATIREAIALIPDDAVVSAAHFTVPHLAHREQIYEFPVPWHAQNWGDFSREGDRLPQAESVGYVLVEDPMEPRYQDVVESLYDEGFEQIFRSAGFLLLRRDTT